MRLIFAILRVTFFIVLGPVRLIVHLLRHPRYEERQIYYLFGPGKVKFPAWADQNETDLQFPLSGGGIQATSARAVVDTGGYGGGALNNDDDRTAIAGRGVGWASAGLIWRAGARLRIYPLFGLQGRGESLIMTGPVDDLRDLSDQLQEEKFQRDDAAVEQVNGVGIDYRLGGCIGITVGLRVGGYGSFFGGRQRPYLYFVIGFGRFKNHNAD